MACADCKIDTGDTVYVCERSECRDAHEQGPCTATRGPDGSVVKKTIDINNPKEVAAALGAENLGKFHEIVGRLSPEQRREAAAHFEVAVSTVDRWAEQTAHPHPALQWQIIRWSLRRLAT